MELIFFRCFRKWLLKYHNNMEKVGKKENGNYWDWLMIMPIKFISILTNGYLKQAIETKKE